MQDVTVKTVFQSLIHSRKFWLVHESLLICFIVYLLTREPLIAAVIMFPFAVNLVSISVEDVGLKISGGTFAISGDMAGGDAIVRGDSVTATTVTKIETNRQDAVVATDSVNTDEVRG